MILIDFDGVMVDFESAFKARYNFLVSTYDKSIPKITKKLVTYGLWDEANGLDKFWVDKTLESLRKQDMPINPVMVDFIEILQKNNYPFKIVTASTKYEETVVYLKRMFNIEKDKVWFVGDKNIIKKCFEYIIEDNPKIAGDNVYLIAHKYNEDCNKSDYAMRGTSKKICKTILKEVGLL